MAWGEGVYGSLWLMENDLKRLMGSSLPTQGPALPASSLPHCPALQGRRDPTAGDLNNAVSRATGLPGNQRCLRLPADTWYREMLSAAPKYLSFRKTAKSMLLRAGFCEQGPGYWGRVGGGGGRTLGEENARAPAAALQHGCLLVCFPSLLTLSPSLASGGKSSSLIRYPRGTFCA